MWASNSSSVSRPFGNSFSNKNPFIAKESTYVGLVPSSVKERQCMYPAGGEGASQPICMFCRNTWISFVDFTFLGSKEIKPKGTVAGLYERPEIPVG